MRNTRECVAFIPKQMPDISIIYCLKERILFSILGSTSDRTCITMQTVPFSIMISADFKRQAGRENGLTSPQLSKRILSQIIESLIHSNTRTQDFDLGWKYFNKYKKIHALSLKQFCRKDSLKKARYSSQVHSARHNSSCLGMPGASLKSFVWIDVWKYKNI